MTGRGRPGPFDLPQPGGRAPAPQPLRLVQDFVNTLDAEHGIDLLAEDAAGWLHAKGLGGGGPVRPAELARLVRVREALRALLLAHTPGGGPAGEAAEVLSAAAGPLRWRIDADGAVHPEAASAPGSRAVAAVLLGAVHRAQASGDWPRLKACPGPRCGWAFYDRSHGARSTWCSMDVCGARAKMRRYRAPR
ncbi:hypothetical protein BIV57_12885 [Mangrovactinospora gilvigrisea]|uniref:Zinc finger CGNR domain-containing protein n=1 Tax=Mangrovactinospora gilvigrisea TaxID=1428644 RepID=A0A1J7C671_9ACTN|nr:CGNR zinc finger domain-containing protein [Mangrovactinospora gilvigrisea]OIV37056.1 hypothetical protein BIV57_12885 [Mangrovactinospora gilvigrisea]